MARAQGWLLDLVGSTTPYAEAWALQRDLLRARQAGSIPDVLVLLEHTPVVTIGRSGDRRHLRASPEHLRARGIEVYEVERGGDVTYHGPGQLVGYPILDLRALNEDIVRFMRTLEASIIATLDAFGIAAARERGYPGVWIGGAKIAAMGVAVKRRVTMHGFALNVSSDLDAFAIINPCGLGRPVTSMAAVLGRPLDVAAVGRVYADRFSDAFGITLRRVTRETVHDALAQAALAPGVSVATR